MASLDGGAARVKVPVDQVVATAFRVVFGRLGRVLDLGWLELLLLLAVELVPGLVTNYLAPDAASPEAADALVLGDIAQSVAAMLCLSAFWVRWQYLLLTAGRETLTGRRFLAAWARFLAYALPFYAAWLGLATAVVMAGTGDAGDDDVITALLAAASVALSLLLARCSLVFPAAVSRRPIGLGTAWRRMRGNTWRFIVTTLLVVAPILMVAVVIVDLILVGAHMPAPEVFAEPLPPGLILIGGLVNAVLAFLFAAVGATILAEFYRRLVMNGRSEG
jgi:hypothetical protein